MSLSATDKREYCVQHGWVGRRAFQRDRHDLCESPTGALSDASLDDVEDPQDGDEGSSEEEDASSQEVHDLTIKEEASEWTRAAARRRGIPPKKTIAVRRITQLELLTGRAELFALGADKPYGRPKKRGECLWCPVCQLVRDGKSNGLDRVADRALGGTAEDLDNQDDQEKGPFQLSPSRPTRLACGHLNTEVIWHSRPCVFVACKHATFLDTSDTGSIILNFPHLEPGEMRADRSCALDLADRGPMTLEEIAVVTNLTRERIRQVELRALIRRARPAAEEMGLGPEDAAALGMAHHVGPGAALEEAGADGAALGDVSHDDDE